MLEEEMTVGPKGQVVIPRSLRKALNIHPGSKVVFKLESNHVIIEKQAVDSVAFFEGIAHRGKSISKISPHEYEEEMSKRGRQ